MAPAANASAIDPFALSLNENPFPPLPAVRSALIGSIDRVNRYPEVLPQRLRGVIAGHLGLSADHVVVGAGATGVLMQALRAVALPGDALALAAPTFDGYPMLAQLAGLTMMEVPLDEHGHNDLAGLADAAARARVVALCRPHNPTGTLEPAAAVMKFLRRVPRDTVVLLDEAYIEFVAPEHRIDMTALLGRFPNVLVVRTFSKAYGLAGLRIGYGLASVELAQALWAQQLPFGTASAGLVAVAASYAAEDQLRQRIQLITAERSYLRRQLNAVGIPTSDAHANFVYLPSRGRLWDEVFADTGLRVRLYPDGGARITVGGRASTVAVLSAVGNSAA